MQRLSKVIAAAGVASRRKCEALIFEGRVKVNGKVTLIPQTMVDLEKDRVEVEGKKITTSQEKVYFLLNKPQGYLCSNTRISRSSKLVLDLFGDRHERLFTVGRLDKETSGLLLVTNDGHFANQVMHPSFGVTKEYLAKTFEEITPRHLESLSKGTYIDGIKILPHKVIKIRRGTVKIVIGEGKKREVRLLIERVGLTLLSLTRIRIGPLLLGKLPEGAYRSLTQKEKESLFSREGCQANPQGQHHPQPLT